MLSKVHPKPAEYSKYLGKVLQTLKIPIRKSEPIPWEEIKSFQSLSILLPPTKILKVVLRLPAPLIQGEETVEAAGKSDVKRKYVEISSLTGKEEELTMKVEELDLKIVSCLLHCSLN